MVTYFWVTVKDAGSKYSKTQLRTSENWKVDFKSFPMVCDMPILSNIGVSYTVGQLSTSTFQQKYGILRTSNVLSPGVLDSVDILAERESTRQLSHSTDLLKDRILVEISNEM